MAKEPQNQGLSTPACGGCTCSSSVVCKETVRMYTANDPTCASNNFWSVDVYSYGVGDPG